MSAEQSGRRGLFRGLLVPVLTPFLADLSVDTVRFTAFCRDLLDEGADGLVVFGTTSEANSLSVDERCGLLDELAVAGINSDRLMPGTGACALNDAVKLTNHALATGAGGVLALPPFYYKNVSDDGIFAYFDALIQRVGDGRLKVYLYQFPQLSNVLLGPKIIARLRKAYPDTVVGLKDSSGNWPQMRRLLTEFPELAIFPSSEARLLEALDFGAAGCISGTANIQASAIARLIAGHGAAAKGKRRVCGLQRQVRALREVFEGFPMIAALKAEMARKTGHEGWRLPRPPLTTLPSVQSSALFAGIDTVRAG